MTNPSTLALLRKVATPVARETKNPKPRQLHPSCWGLICPMDTPEGSACGLTKSLAMLAHVLQMPRDLAVTARHVPTWHLQLAAAIAAAVAAANVESVRRLPKHQPQPHRLTGCRRSPSL